MNQKIEAMRLALGALACVSGEGENTVQYGERKAAMEGLRKAINAATLTQMQAAAKPAEFMVGQRVILRQYSKESPPQIVDIARNDGSTLWVRLHSAPQRILTVIVDQIEALPNGQL